MNLAERGRALFFRFVWNRGTLLAILFTSPAILTAVGSFAMARWVGDDIAALTRQRDGASQTMRELESFVRDVERHQLDRAAFLMALNAQNADVSLKYALDRLFRLNAQGAMRRVAAVLSSAEWQARSRPYDALLARDYAAPETVAELQTMESGMIAEAGGRLTMLQAQVNAQADRLDRLNADKTFWQTLGTYLLQLLTILIFFLKTNVA